MLLSYRSPRAPGARQVMLNALIAIMGDTFDRVQQSKVATAIYR